MKKIKFTIHVDTYKVPNKTHLDALIRYPSIISKSKKTYNRQQFKKFDK